jgi:hypothetical protein
MQPRLHPLGRLFEIRDLVSDQATLCSARAVWHAGGTVRETLQDFSSSSSSKSELGESSKRRSLSSSGAVLGARWNSEAAGSRRKVLSVARSRQKSIVVSQAVCPFCGKPRPQPSTLEPRNPAAGKIPEKPTTRSRDIAIRTLPTASPVRGGHADSREPRPTSCVLGRAAGAMIAPTRPRPSESAPDGDSGQRHTLKCLAGFWGPNGSLFGRLFGRPCPPGKSKS